MIDGLTVQVDAEAVVVRAEGPLAVVSSAVVGGGLGTALAIVNVHVPKGFRCEQTEGVLADFARRHAVAAPWIGLLTAARTENAEQASATAGGLKALAVVTIGLSNAVGAGRSGVATWAPSTINTIVVVDGTPEPAALINLVATATETKTLALAEAGFRAADGGLASGTSTDAIAVAATGRGRRCRFGGPASELGALVAGAAKTALDAGIRRWISEHR